MPSKRQMLTLTVFLASILVLALKVATLVSLKIVVGGKEITVEYSILYSTIDALVMLVSAATAAFIGAYLLTP